MPVVHVNLVEGRDPQMLNRLLRGISEVVCSTLECSPATVSVILHEVPAERWMRSGITIAEERTRRSSATAHEAGA
jgi:4-oxalocrotonate tautomerase